MTSTGGTTVPFSLFLAAGYSQGTDCMSGLLPYISLISEGEKPPPMKMARGICGSGFAKFEPRPDTGIVCSPASKGGNSDLPLGADCIAWTTAIDICQYALDKKVSIMRLTIVLWQHKTNEVFRD